MERSHSQERKDKGSHFLLSSYAETNVTHVTSASSPFGDTRSGFRKAVAFLPDAPHGRPARRGRLLTRALIKHNYIS
jgi:hypothetical protein